MAHAENEIVINKPVSVIFNFLADGNNNTLWRPAVISIELKAGQASQRGAEYRQVLKGPGGRPIEGDYRITSLSPNNKLAFEVIAGPAKPTGVYSFEVDGDSTKVKFMLDYQPKGLAKLMGPMIQKTIEKEVGQLSNLKQVLEK